MLESIRGRSAYLLVATVVVLVAVVTLLLSGSHVRTILSTVGSPIGAGGADAPVMVDPPVPAPTSAHATADQPALAAVSVPALLIVRTGTLELEVADLSQAIAAADAAVTRSGGYVSASTRAANAGDSSAQTTYRIPSASWDTTLGALRGIARTVTAEETKTEEVTGQVIDLAARIANLRATEAALQAIMAKATKISDVLDVQKELTTTRGDIERLVAEKTGLADRAAYGSLGVTFRLPVPPKPAATPMPPKGWDPGADVANASGKLVRIGQRTTSIGIWLAIVGLPVIIGGAVLLVLGWQAVRLGRWMLGRRTDAVAD